MEDEVLPKAAASKLRKAAAHPNTPSKKRYCRAPQRRAFSWRRHGNDGVQGGDTVDVVSTTETRSQMQATMTRACSTESEA